jgi:hypothetical protein
MPLDALLATSAEARHRYWSALGRVDSDVLGQLIASQFIPGMPVWPSGREVYLVVHRKDTTILATDGLSDPDDGEFRDCNGYGLEVFIEVPTAALLTPQDSPYFHILTQVARNVAYSGGIVEPWSKYQLLSMELPTSPEMARQLVNPQGRHILLLGMPGFDRMPAIEGMPLSETKAMAVTIVHPDDFAKVAREGGQGRVRLAEALAQSGHEHVSDFARQPVL